ncbi:hypothetical protein MTR_3g092175 [Medicago truncatula]|uniref:Uncharacterized protein n=1 Tax=Medicago truncatula TaxID=3880 RepID=A0A072V0E6_MEDTR|nr:hypothetical protein MTR_3g092175 [Medicago truncatula]
MTNKTTSHKDDDKNNVALRRRNQESKNEIYVKITYFNKREIEKTGCIVTFPGTSKTHIVIMEILKSFQANLHQLRLKLLQGLCVQHYCNSKISRIYRCLHSFLTTLSVLANLHKFVKEGDLGLQEKEQTRIEKLTMDKNGLNV